jgi:hypothetical protein
MGFNHERRNNTINRLQRKRGKIITRDRNKNGGEAKNVLKAKI